MKSSYTTPKLIVYGDVAEITQILGGDQRRDFAFFSGQIVSQSNDLGSRDIQCRNADCT